METHLKHLKIMCERLRGPDLKLKESAIFERMCPIFRTLSVSIGSIFPTSKTVECIADAFPKIVTKPYSTFC